MQRPPQRPKNSLDDVVYLFDINDYTIEAVYEILGDHDRLAIYNGESQAVEPSDRVILLPDDPTVEDDIRFKRKPRTPLALEFPLDLFLADYRDSGARTYNIRAELANDDKKEIDHEGGEKKYFSNLPLAHVDCRMIGTTADLLRAHPGILAAYLKLPGEYKIVIGSLLWALKNRLKKHLMFTNVKLMDDKTLSAHERNAKFEALSAELNAKWDTLIASLDVTKMCEIIDTFHIHRPCQARFINIFTRLQLLEYNEQDKTTATMLAEFINTIKRKRYTGLLNLRPFELREAMYETMAEECEHFYRQFISQDLKVAADENLRALGAMSKLCRMAPLDEHNRAEYCRCASDILRGFQSVVRLMPNPDDDCSPLLLKTIAPLALSKCADLVVISGTCERLREINDTCIAQLDDDLAAASPALTVYIAQLQKLRSRFLWEKTKGDMDFTDVSLQDAEEIFEYSKTCAILQIATLTEIKESDDIATLQKLIDESDKEGDNTSAKFMILNDANTSEKEKAIKLVNLARTIRRLPAIVVEGEFRDAAAKEKFKAFINSPLIKLNEQDAREFWLHLIANDAPKKMVHAMGFMVQVLEAMNNPKLTVEERQTTFIYLLQHFAIESTFKINLNGCNFDGCHANKGRPFSNINRNGINFSHVSILDATLCYCSLVNMDCEGSNFSKSQVLQCSFEHGQFRQCYMNGSHLTDSRFCQASFSNVEMIDTLVSGCDFTGASFTDCKLARSSFTNTVFDHTNFTRCDLTEVKLRNTVFNNATLNNVNLCQVNLSGVSFNNCKMLNVSLINKDEKISFDQLDLQLDQWHRCGIPIQIVYENLEANLNNAANNYSASERHAILLIMRGHAYFAMPGVEYSPTLFSRMQKSKDMSEAIRAKVETMFQQAANSLQYK